MAASATGETARPRLPRWLQALYLLPLLSALALLVLVIGEVVYSFEDEHEHGRHDHGFYGPIFDGAWVVFVPTFLLSAIAGVVAVVVGWIRASRALGVFGLRALGFCVVAIAVILVAESLS